MDDEQSEPTQEEIDSFYERLRQLPLSPFIKGAIEASEMDQVLGPPLVLKEGVVLSEEFEEEEFEESDHDIREWLNYFKKVNKNE